MNLEFGYIILSITMTLIVLLFGSHTIDRAFEDHAKRKYKKTMLWIGLILWHTYIFIIGRSGILQDLSLPPRLLIFIILPAFLFIGIFLFKNKNKNWITHIPEHWLLFIQTFRIGIEILFVYSVAKGILPALVTIEGYNFDIVFSSTAPFIGYLHYKRKSNSRKWALAWNYIGLAVIASIIFLFVTSIYFPQFYGSSTALMPKEFGLYPYPLVPAFLMPLAVFIHVLSILQLRKKI